MKDDTQVLPVSQDANPAVDRRILDEIAKVNARLAALGILPSSGYGIAPALGGDVVKAPSNPAASANAAYPPIARPSEMQAGPA